MSTLRWESKTRYYAAKIYKDMLGDWIVAVAFGGKKNNLGQIKTHPVRSEADALREVAALAVKRRKRKYAQVN